MELHATDFLKNEDPISHPAHTRRGAGEAQGKIAIVRSPKPRPVIGQNRRIRSARRRTRRECQMEQQIPLHSSRQVEHRKL